MNFGIQPTKFNVPVINILLSRMDNYSNSIHYFKYINIQTSNNFMDYTDFENGIKQFTMIFTQCLPRKYLPNKEYWTQNELTNKIFPEMHVFNRDITIVFGGLVTIFNMGGVVCLILSSFIFGVFLSLLQYNFSKLIISDYFAIIYISIFLNLPILYFSEGFIGTPRLHDLIIRIIIFIPITYYLTNSPINKEGKQWIFQ